MDDISKFAGGTLLIALLIFVVPLMGCFFGAFSGWVVSLFFNDTILGFLARLGVNTAGLELWQVGASMGFFGGFLKTSVASKK